jgi:hypothetical protein
MAGHSKSGVSFMSNDIAINKKNIFVVFDYGLNKTFFDSRCYDGEECPWPKLQNLLMKMKKTK